MTIHATFMFGSSSTTVTVTGETPSEAWNALARAAIAWRNSDYQHVPMWGGGGQVDAAEVLRVLDELDSAGVRAGITGGWGVDALLRRETRQHGDLDLGVSTQLVDTAIAALEPLGYVVELDERPARVSLVSKTGKVDLHPIVWDASGGGVQIGLDGQQFVYPAGSLDAEGEIGGRVVRCGTPELQVAFHSHYEPREHDRRDMAALAAAFDVSLPPAYRA